MNLYYLWSNILLIKYYRDINSNNIVIRKNEEFRDLTELGRDTDD